MNVADIKDAVRANTMYRVDDRSFSAFIAMPLLAPALGGVMEFVWIATYSRSQHHHLSFLFAVKANIIHQSVSAARSKVCLAPNPLSGNGQYKDLWRM